MKKKFEEIMKDPNSASEYDISKQEFAFILDNLPNTVVQEILIVLHELICNYNKDDWKYIVSQFSNQNKIGHFNLIYFLGVHTEANIKFIDEISLDKTSIGDFYGGFDKLFLRLRVEDYSSNILYQSMYKRYNINENNLRKLKSIGSQFGVE